MNALSFAVLRRLAEGEFQSGAALAHAFDVSRGTIWNAIRAIESAGLRVYKVRGRGYRLPQSLSLLTREAIEAHISDGASRFALDIVDAVPSTNTLLLARAAAGAGSGEVVIAEWQTRGRGRLGRAWHAGPCGALTFSLVWRFAKGAAALAGLSLAVGLALARALERVGAADVRLKWPNDIVWRGRKLAGILIEMQGDALGPSTVVIGVGLNVRVSPEALAAIGQPAVDLETVLGKAVDRNRVLGAILAELGAVLDRFEAGGFAPFRTEWEARHAHRDRPIELSSGGGAATRGIARGVGDDGALLVETSAGLKSFHSGDVTLRAAPPEPAAA